MRCWLRSPCSPGLLLCVTLFAGCSSLPRPITDPQQQFAVRGAAVTAPGTDGWQLLHEDDEIVSFGKALGDDGHMLTAMLVATPFEFVDFDTMYERLRQEPPEEDRRFRRPQSTLRRVGAAEPPYVELRLEVEDHAVPGAEGRRLITKGITRWYLLPEDGSAVTATFSERRPLGTLPTDFGAAAERFFAGVRLDAGR